MDAWCAEFKCLYGLPPEDDIVSAELEHYGFQFGPCLGRRSKEPERMERCEDEWKVLVWDDEIQMNSGLVEMVTNFELEKPHNAKEQRLIFSKPVAIEMITVSYKTVLWK